METLLGTEVTKSRGRQMAKEFTEKRYGEIEAQSRKERYQKTGTEETSSNKGPHGLGLQHGIAHTAVERSVQGGDPTRRAEPAPEPIDVDERDS